MKLTDEQKKHMDELKKEGLNNNQISLRLGINYSSVQYYLNEKYREKVKTKNKENYKEYYRKNKEKILEKTRDYRRDYMRKRYQQDPEFRKKQIERVKNEKSK